VEFIPTLLYVVFAVLATAGAFLALYTWRGLRWAIPGAVATLLFFVVLFVALLAAMRASGLV
jgi:predicted tellurium resistance membrane protein TerC